MSWTPVAALAVRMAVGLAIAVGLWRRRASRGAAPAATGPPSRQVDAETLSRFVTDLSHELRTPLTLILGPLESALDGDYGELDEPLRNQLRVARVNALRQLRLLNQLLSLAKLEAGQLRLRLAKLDLGSLLERQVEAFSSLAERRGIELRILRETASSIWADREQLEQVFANLLSNALKFTPSGGRIEVRLCSVLSAAGEPVALLATVADTGRGIPAEALPQLFDRYYQVPGRRRPPGTGIGLAVAHELIGLHGGRLTAASSPGEGTTFEVRLLTGFEHFEQAGWERVERPTDALSTETRIEISLSEGLAEEVEPGRSPTVGVASAADSAADERPLLLIVDDHPQMRQHLRHCLGEGYRYHEAADGAEALERIEQEDPELIVSDVVMPRIDGLELCRRIRESPGLDHLPLILLSARAEVEDRLVGLRHGADDYVPKPFSRRELSARVANLIARRRRLRERARTLGFARLGEVSATPLDEAFLRRAIEAVEARLADPELSVAALASGLAMSPRTLQRKLKALAGSSPQELVRSLRLTRARELLESGTASVSEVAYAVGYSEPATFSRAFRERFGAPPSTVTTKP